MIDRERECSVVHITKINKINSMDQINCWSFFIIILYFQCKAKYPLLLNVLLKAAASCSCETHICHLLDCLLGWLVAASLVWWLSFTPCTTRRPQHCKKTKIDEKINIWFVSFGARKGSISRGIHLIHRGCDTPIRRKNIPLSGNLTQI